MYNYDSTYLIFAVLYFIWLVICVIQQFLAYGTAYRKTKKTGDNGVHLFIWLFVYSLAAVIPFLGYYLWKKSKQEENVI
ncbi:hypothetical protein MKL26_06120 [Streptococcus suis]|nr:hypothetical protein [Streptococcus suis]